jgi:predicted dinucleotide-binding enzyme
MRIGVIGSGMIGGTLAGLLAGLGHDIALANSRGPQSLRGFAAEHPGVVPVSAADAAGHGQLVVVAIPFGRYTGLPGPAFTGRAVIDTTNYYPDRDGRFPLLDSGETTSSELIAAHLAGARVVKAFNTIYYRQLLTGGRSQAPREQRLAIPVAGDDPGAKDVTALLIAQLGFTAVGTGPLAGSACQQPGSPLFNVPVTAAQARQLLGHAQAGNHAPEKAP